MTGYCKNCGRELTNDEIGLHKKLCGKASESFLCITCLSVYFDVTEDLLRDKIKQFRDMGCSLFVN